jgi:hypothetical protein
LDPIQIQLIRIYAWIGEILAVSAEMETTNSSFLVKDALGEPTYMDGIMM